MEPKIFRFYMSRIQIEQFAILSEIPPQTGDCMINSEIRVGVSMGNQSVRMIYGLTIVDDEGNKHIYLQLACEFKIQEEDWNEMLASTDNKIPKNMLEFFASQTVGTARGVIHCKTEGTAYNHLILPPINITSIGLQDFDLNELN